MKIWMLAGIIVLSSCYPEQDLAPVKDPTTNPVATITAMGDYSTITEGDTLKYSIELSAFVTQDITFGVIVDEATTATEGDDYEIVGGKVTAFTSSSELWILILADDFPEVDEIFKAEVSSFADGGSYSFQLSTESSVIAIDGSIANVNDPGYLSIGVSWAEAGDDWDTHIIDVDAGAYQWRAWTGSNPEMQYLDNTSASVNFTLGADAYAVDATVNTLTVSVGYPDGTVEFQEVVVDTSNPDNATDITGSILLATITKSGTSYTLAY